MDAEYKCENPFCTKMEHEDPGFYRMVLAKMEVTKDGRELVDTFTASELNMYCKYCVSAAEVTVVCEQ